jgi:hypothetical protein
VTQTWTEFRNEFSRAQREQCIISSTSSGAGYNNNNVTEHYGCDQIPADGALSTAMASLTTVTSDDHETVAALTETITSISETLAATDVWAKEKLLKSND